MIKNSSHQFQVEHAIKYGVEEAVIIHHFAFWIEKNAANGHNLHEGRVWCYNSAKALSIVFPYWSPKKIRNLLEKLVEQGVFIKGNFNQNTYNRTLWFAFADLHSEMGNCIPQNGRMDVTHSGESNMPNGEIFNVKTDTKPDTKPDMAVRDKKSNVKSLEETTMDDLRPWIEEQQKAGVIFDGINIHIELQKCKNRFEGEKRKIGTARNWLLNAVEYAKPATGILKPPTRPTFTPQPPSRGSVVVGSPEYHRLQKELGLE